MATNRFTSRSTFLERVEIPEGILTGAVIGKGGSNSKRISTTHRVRFQVESDTRVVMISGSRNGVDGAVSDLLELFEQLHNNVRERQHQHHAVRGSQSQSIHVIAAKRHGRQSSWGFELAPQEVLDADLSVEAFQYRLTEYGGDEDQDDGYDEDDSDDEEPPTPWISQFNARFHQRMVLDAAAIAQTATRPIKIKAAFGQTCFALPDATLVNGERFAWGELQRLELYSQVKPRWSNAGNNRSMAFGKLVGELEALYTNKTETVFREDLTVYMNSRNRVGRQLDISAKFRRVDDKWVPVVRRPVRIVHALYNVAMDNDTAFRIRVYSREDAPETIEYSDLASQLEISERVSGDLFSTEVKPLPGFPADLAIRTHAVKRKTRVYWQGLRFAVSYMNANHDHISLACTLASLEEDSSGQDNSPENVLDELVDKVVNLVEQ